MNVNTTPGGGPAFNQALPGVPATLLAKKGPGGKYGPRVVIWLSELLFNMDIQRINGYSMLPTFTWNNQYVLSLAFGDTNTNPARNRIYEYTVDGKQYCLPWWTKYTHIPAHLLQLIERHAREPVHKKFFKHLHNFINNEVVVHNNPDLAMEYAVFADTIGSRTLAILALAAFPTVTTPMDGPFVRAFITYMKHFPEDTAVHRIQRRRVREWFMHYVHRKENLDSLKTSGQYLDIFFNEEWMEGLTHLCIDADKLLGNS
jgi:hypothetical protein